MLSFPLTLSCCQPNFFKQFNVVCVDEAHTSKAATLTTILRKTFGHAHYRLGMSGTYPGESTSEWMAIESVTGPKLIKVKAKELMSKGLISNVKVKCLLLQYDDHEFAESVYTIKKHGGGKRALELEKEYAKLHQEDNPEGGQTDRRGNGETGRGDQGESRRVPRPARFYGRPPVREADPRGGHRLGLDQHGRRYPPH